MTFSFVSFVKGMTSAISFRVEQVSGPAALDLGLFAADWSSQTDIIPEEKGGGGGILGGEGAKYLRRRIHFWERAWI